MPIMATSRMEQTLARTDLTSRVSAVVNLPYMLSEANLGTKEGWHTIQLGNLIHHFQTSTVLSISIPPIALFYQKEIVRLAFNVSDTDALQLQFLPSSDFK